jgi:integrase
MRHNLNLLSRFLAWAIERGFATVNPVRMIPQGRRPKGSAGGADDAPWIRDDETVHRLMAALPRPVDLMFYLGNRSGLRPGEVAGLQMEDFSWLAEGIIRVAHSYDGPLKEDKAGAGKVKWVPAPEDIGQVVGPWLAQRKSEGAGPRDLVFPFKPAKPQNRRRTSTWKGFRKEYVEACWEEAARAVGVEMTLYQATRHSFVSRHLANGVPLDEVSAAVGHSSPEVTKRFYAHYVRRGFSAEIRRGLSRSAA